MTKIFSADYRTGSYIDSVNKIVGVPTSLSKLIRTEKGTALARVVNHNGVTYTTGSKSLSKFTIVAWIKQRTTDDSGRYCVAQIGNTQIMRRYFSSTNYSNYFNAAGRGFISIPITTSLNKWMQFVVTYDGVNVVSSVNNKQIVGSPSETTATLDFTSIIVGTAVSALGYSDSDILKFDVYDDVISDKEIELDYKALLDTQITEKPVRGFELVKPTDLSYLKDDKLGTNLTDNYDFMSWISTDSAFVSKTSNSFTTNNAGGGVSLNSQLTIGKKYRMTIRGTTTSGYTVTNTAVSPTYATFGVGDFNSTIDFTATTITSIYLRNTAAGTTTITHLSFQEVTGLVAAYNMIPNGNTLVDISGNGNNGTITGGVIQGKEGLVFDGTTGYVNFANTKLATSDFTVITRVKLNDYPILAKNIISTPTLDNGRFLGIYNKSIGLYNGSDWISGATELTPKQEYTLAYVCDGSVINLYVDGVLDVTGSKGPYNGLSLEIIGKWTTDFSRNISGVIKDIRFCNRALSVQEIKAYHNSFIKPAILEDWSGSAVGDTI